MTLAEEAQKDSMTGATVMALHLRNLHGLDLRSLSPIVTTPAEYRQTDQSLYSSPGEITIFRGQMSFGGLQTMGMLLGQVSGAIDKMAKKEVSLSTCTFWCHLFQCPAVQAPTLLRESSL